VYCPSQDLQVPVQAELQQKPLTQNVLAHSAAVEQGEPLGLLPTTHWENWQT
jgi:hypothetical protein